MRIKDAKIGTKPSPNLLIIGKVFKDKCLKVKCKCVCGNEKDMRLAGLGTSIKSCGCLAHITRFNGVRNRKGSLANNGIKKCSSCLKEQNISNYSYSKHSPDKLHHQCKRCDRTRRFERVYKITKEKYEEMFIIQNGRCAICKKTQEEIRRCNGRVRYLAIDHCHKTGKVRGLLCINCNTAIGALKDSALLAQICSIYLKESEKDMYNPDNYDESWLHFQNELHKENLNI